MRKETEFQTKINLQLEKIALGNFILSTRKRKIKHNMSLNASSESIKESSKQQNNRDMILANNHKKSKESIEHYLQKSINKQS